MFLNDVGVRYDCFVFFLVVVGEVLDVQAFPLSHFVTINSRLHHTASCIIQSDCANCQLHYPLPVALNQSNWQLHHPLPVV